MRYFLRGRSKYGAKKEIVDGITFASRKEAGRYAQLKILKGAGRVEDLELQPSFLLQDAFKGRDGKTIRAITYRADFRYYDPEMKKTVIEDVKGFETPEYKLKRKMFLKGLKETEVFVEIR